MTKTVLATFDGEVFRPHEPPALPPNTEVRLTIEESDLVEGEPYCFLDIVESANLEGPPDWAARLDDYLYGQAGERAA